MAPCENVLLKKIQRTNILTALIKNACNPNIDIDLNNGWYINENKKIAIEYFDGSPYPGDITEIISIDNSDDKNDDENVEDDCAIESDDSDIYDTEDD